MKFRHLIIDIIKQFKSDRVLDQSARLAFYFLLSFFPLIIFLVMLLGLVMQSANNFQAALHSYLSAVAPASVLELIEKTLREIIQSSSSSKLSLVLLFFWTSGNQAMLAMMEGLNIAYEVKEARRWERKYALATTMTLAILLLNLVTILLLIYGAPIMRFAMGLLGWGENFFLFWSLLRWPVLILQLFLVFCLVYRFGPYLDNKHQIPVIRGAFVAVSSWLLVSFGFKFYLSMFDRYTLIYGSIGTVIILMFWFYLSAAAILLGAIVNAVSWRHQMAETGQQEFKGI